MQRARSQVKPSTTSQPILSAPGPTKLTVGNWSLTCLKEGEIAIHNSDGQQATILKEDLPGFVFESNRGTKHSFTAETSLGKYVGMCNEQVGASVDKVGFVSLFGFHTCGNSDFFKKKKKIHCRVRICDWLDW